MARKNEPDAAHANLTPEYISQLVDLCMERHQFTSQSAVAARIGVGMTTMKNWKSGVAKASYCNQFTLERLAGL